MEDPKYILATKKDLEMVVNYRLAFSDEIVGKQSVEAEAALRESLIAYFKKELNKNYICWYAKIGDEVAAIGGLGIRTAPGNVKNPSGKWGYIMSIYTVPHHRKKGLCTNILNKLMESAQERGIHAFELHSTKIGEPVYINNGFELFPEPTYRKFL